ncbi:MAG: hypothetical protein ACOX7B_03265 [Christensenellales bacterium]|jgi:hypothetical protein
MAQKGITRYTKTDEPPHITAGDDAAIYRAVFGSVSGITEADNQLACTRVNDTTVSIATGVFSNQGFLLRVDAPIQLTTEIGQVGFFRRDLVVAEYTVGGGSTSDTHVLKVIKGVQNASEASAKDPVLEQDDLRTGVAGDVRQEPLYRIRISGTAMSATIDRIAPLVGSYYA